MSSPETSSSKEQEKKITTSEVSEQEKKDLDKASSKELSLQLNDVKSPEQFDFDKNMQTLGDIKLSPEQRNTLAESVLNKVIVSPSLLPTYLWYLKPDTLRYLWSDTQTQIKLYNLLVWSSSCKAIATRWSQFEKNLIDLRLAIDHKNTLSLTEQIKDLSKQTKDKINEFFNNFGGALLSMANLFWWKDALKKFCKTFNVNLDANIDALYKGTYSLDGATLQWFYDGFSGKTENDIGKYYSSETRLDAKAIPQDPNFLNKTNFDSLDLSLIDKANKASLNIPDLLIPNWSLYGEPQYKINPTILLASDQKQRLVSQIFDDPALWQNIKALQKVNPDDLYGKDNPEKNKLWYKKYPDLNEPKELAVVVGAYLMKWPKDLKHVLNESALPYEQQHLDKRAALQKKPDTPEQDSDLDTLKKSRVPFFADLDTTGKWGKYPLTLDQEKVLTPTQRTEYWVYKKAIAEKIATLVDPNASDFASLTKDPVLKAKVNPFLTKHFSIYLASLKDNTDLYKDSNKKAIDSVIATLWTIKTDLSIWLDTDGKVFITWKDSIKPIPKDIKIDSTAFSWLPSKK